MKKVVIKRTGNILREESTYEGMPLEYVLVKVTQEKTPIESVSPEIFTERKDGVQPQYDIRTDKWDIAHESMVKVAEARILQVEEREKNKRDKKDDENIPETPILTNKKDSE